MSVPRLVLVLLIGLLPLAGVRALWWSPLLFARPWEQLRFDGKELDLGAFQGVFTGVYGGALTVLAGLLLALLIDTLTGVLQRLTLPLLLLLALATAAAGAGLHPAFPFASFWILAGFASLAVAWLYACLQVGREA